VQQTPYPLAQLPSLVPPLFEHSDLKLENIHCSNKLFQRTQKFPILKQHIVYERPVMGSVIGLLYYTVTNPITAMGEAHTVGN
jgi:hypothetical protein